MGQSWGSNTRGKVRKIKEKVGRQFAEYNTLQGEGMMVTAAGPCSPYSRDQVLPMVFLDEVRCMHMGQAHLFIVAVREAPPLD